MKLSPRETPRALAAPDPAIRAWLIYGPDRGLVRERAEALAAKLVADPDDPFAVTRLTEDDLKSDPAALSDAMAALSLVGGARLVRLRLGSEAGGAAAAGFLADFEADKAVAEATLIVEAGDLKPAGKLRKMFEGARRAAAVACYADAPRELADLVDAALSEAGLALSAEARALWLPLLEGDRGLARSEIEKLILYKGLHGSDRDSDRVEAADILASAAGAGEAALDVVVDAALGGDPRGADSAWSRASDGGASAVGLVRALQRRLDQLGEVEAAGGSDAAMMRCGAPRYGPANAAFKAQLGLWRGRRLDAAREAAFEAERAIKRSGAPAEALAGALILRLARGAEAVRRR